MRNYEICVRRSRRSRSEEGRLSLTPGPLVTYRGPRGRTDAGQRMGLGLACFTCCFFSQHFLPSVSDCSYHVSCKSRALFPLNEVTLRNCLVTMPSEGKGTFVSWSPGCSFLCPRFIISLPLDGPAGGDTGLASPHRSPTIRVRLVSTGGIALRVLCLFVCFASVADDVSRVYPLGEKKHLRPARIP